MPPPPPNYMPLFHFGVPKSALCHKIIHLVAGFHAFWPPFAIMFSHTCIFIHSSKRHVHYKVNSPLYEDSTFPRYNQIKENIMDKHAR
jgi:hypothetical protein